MPNSEPNFAKLAEKASRAMRNALNAQDVKAFCQSVAQESFGSLDEEKRAPLAQWMGAAASRWLIANGRAQRVGAGDLPKGAPQWAQDALARGDELVSVELDDLLRKQLAHIGDWLRANPQRQLGKLSFAQAIRATADEDEHNAKRTAPDEDPEGIQAIAEMPAGELGARWVRVVSAQSLDREGVLMRHCVGSYAEEVEEEESVIYSLRDADNKPLLTVEQNELTDDWREYLEKEAGWSRARVKKTRAVKNAVMFHQVRGPRNSEPTAEQMRAVIRLIDAVEAQGAFVAHIEQEIADERGPLPYIFSDESARARFVGDLKAGETIGRPMALSGADLALLPEGCEFKALRLDRVIEGQPRPKKLKAIVLEIAEGVRSLDARDWSIGEVSIADPFKMKGARLAFGAIDSIQSDSPSWEESEDGSSGFWGADGLESLSASARKAVLPWLRVSSLSLSGVETLDARGMDAKTAKIQWGANVRADGRWASKAIEEAFASAKIAPIESAAKTEGERLERLNPLSEALSGANWLVARTAAHQAIESAKMEAARGDAKDNAAAQQSARETIALAELWDRIALHSTESGILQTLHAEGADFAQFGNYGPAQTMSAEKLEQASQRIEDALGQTLRAALAANEKLRRNEALAPEEELAFEKTAPAELWRKAKNPENDRNGLVFKGKLEDVESGLNELDRRLPMQEIDEEEDLRDEFEQKTHWFDKRQGVAKNAPSRGQVLSFVGWQQRFAMTLAALGVEPGAAQEWALDGIKKMRLAGGSGSVSAARGDWFAAEAETSAQKRRLDEWVAKRFEPWCGQPMEQAVAAHEAATAEFFAQWGRTLEKDPALAKSQDENEMSRWFKERALEASARAALTAPSQGESFSSPEEAINLICAAFVLPARLRAAQKACARQIAKEWAKAAREEFKGLISQAQQGAADAKADAQPEADEDREREALQERMAAIMPPALSEWSLKILSATAQAPRFEALVNAVAIEMAKEVGQERDEKARKIFTTSFFAPPRTDLENDGAPLSDRLGRLANDKAPDEKAAELMEQCKLQWGLPLRKALALALRDKKLPEEQNSIMVNALVNAGRPIRTHLHGS